MQKMSGLDLLFVMSELSPLCGKRISKIRKTENGIYLFKIGTDELLFQPGVRLHLTRQQLSGTETPDGFISLLRKNFEGKTAQEIRQHENDRIVEIVTRSKEKIIFELFRKGNLIFVGEDGRIVSCMAVDEASGRKVARGELYAYPAATNFTFKKPEKIGFIVSENEKGEPTGFSLDAASPGRAFPTFSEALDHYHANQKEESEAERSTKGKVKKLQERQSSQEETLKKMEKERIEAKEKGEAVYLNYEKIERLISLVKEMKKNGASDEEVEKALSIRMIGTSFEVEL